MKFSLQQKPQFPFSREIELVSRMWQRLHLFKVAQTRKSRQAVHFWTFQCCHWVCERIIFETVRSSQVSVEGSNLHVSVTGKTCSTKSSATRCSFSQPEVKLPFFPAYSVTDEWKRVLLTHRLPASHERCSGKTVYSTTGRPEPGVPRASLHPSAGEAEFFCKIGRLPGSVFQINAEKVGRSNQIVRASRLPDKDENEFRRGHLDEHVRRTKQPLSFPSAADWLRSFHLWNISVPSSPRVNQWTWIPLTT